MLIWINGAFGAGKTSVARELARRRGDVRLIDPERIGFMLRRVWPAPMTGDFQDLPVWRALTLRLLAEAAAAAAGPVVVPMTLASPAYFEEIVGGLRAGGVELRHFTLMASAATLRRRLRRRLAWPSSRRWALARVEPCLAALSSEQFAVHLDTERRTVAAVAEDILARSGADREAEA